VEVAFRPTVILVLLGCLLNATGRSTQAPALQSLVSKFSDPQIQGATFGLYHMLGSLGRVIGPAIATAIYAAHHTAPFALAGSITFVAALWTMALRARAPEERRGFAMAQPVIEAG